MESSIFLIKKVNGNGSTRGLLWKAYPLTKGKSEKEEKRMSIPFEGGCHCGAVPYVVSEDPITIIKKALMLELMDKSIPKRKRVISKTEIGLIKKWGEEIAEITKYNKYIFDTMMKKNNVHIDIPLDELIRNTLIIANIKPDEDVIFISNECRLIHYPNKPLNQKNQTMNSTTGPSVQILRDESRN